ncbi:MAG: hypothetical protein P8Y95_08505 [Gammaproteobacteria bacterium]|jgi:hypothetical protein
MSVWRSRRFAIALAASVALHVLGGAVFSYHRLGAQAPRKAPAPILSVDLLPLPDRVASPPQIADVEPRAQPIERPAVATQSDVLAPHQEELPRPPRLNLELPPDFRVRRQRGSHIFSRALRARLALQRSKREWQAFLGAVNVQRNGLDPEQYTLAVDVHRAQYKTAQGCFEVQSGPANDQMHRSWWMVKCRDQASRVPWWERTIAASLGD